MSPKWKTIQISTKASKYLQRSQTDYKSQFVLTKESCYTHNEHNVSKQL
jgi:hypothetical protein